MSERVLSAEEVDLMIGRTWFSNHGDGEVVVHDAPVTWPELDAEARAASHGGPERRLFVHGLQVEGTLRLGRGVPAIYVVLGELHAKRIELGDGVLAVAGRVTAEEYLWAPRTEAGTFAVGPDATSDDATIPALPPVNAPIVVWFDVRRRCDQLFTRGAKSLQRVAPDAFPPPLKALYDAGTERFTDEAAALAVLRSGQWRVSPAG